MTFKQGLVNARSHLIFLVALMAAFGLIYSLESIEVTPANAAVAKRQLVFTEDIKLAEPRDLTAREREWAKRAWQYFENNYQPDTGLVNSTDGYTATTLWDTASYMLGMISAYRLNIIEQPKFEARMKKALISLGKMELFEGKLPNKSYNTKTLAMTNYENKLSPRGIGWSAIDIARFLVPVNVIIWNYPELNEYATALVKKWDIQASLEQGMLMGAMIDSLNKTKLVQEGRIGYEEYAARTLLLMGYDASEAMDIDDYLHIENIYDVGIPTDSRIPEAYDAHNYVVSESYILGGLEFGLDHISKEFAWRVYEAQEKRYKSTKILTAVSEDHIDRAPWFVYNTVFTDGKAWNTITDTGADASEHRSLSAKAAIGWHALFATDYTKQLADAVDDLATKDQGFYSGIYEQNNEINKSLTANTNGVILESLHYIKHGPLLQIYED